MKEVSNKISSIKQLQTKMEKYDVEIPKFTNKFDTNISEQLDIIGKKTKQLDDIKNFESYTTENLIKLWSNLDEINHIFKNIIYEIDNISGKHQHELVLNITDLNLKKINDLHANIKVTFNKYCNESDILDVEIVKKIQEILYKKFTWDKSKVKNNIDELSNLTKKYIYSISLYTILIQRVIDKCIPYGIDICEYILNQVEDVKDYILTCDEKIKKIPKHMVQSNVRLKTFGLTPNGPSDKLSNITKSIFKSSVKTISGLDTIAKKEKICIVLLNSIINHPIEFSLWKLIDWDTAKKYTQNENDGVAQKTIDRLTTIAFKNLGNGKKWDFSIKHFGSIDSKYFVILENISYDDFRIYSIYKETIPIQGGGKKEIKLERNQISEFIEYVKNDGVYNNNTRVSVYNAMQEKKMLNNMFLPIKFNINNINTKSQIIDSKYLRNALEIQLKKEFDNIIKKSFKDGVNVKSTKDLGKIIHDQKMSDIFNNILMEQYDIYTFKNKDNANPFPFAETLQTFLAILYQLNTQFTRKMHDSFVATEIDKNIFEESNANAKKLQLQKIFNDIITPLLKRLISDESNIYQSLIYKNSLLKLQVVN